MNLLTGNVICIAIAFMLGFWFGRNRTVDHARTIILFIVLCVLFASMSRGILDQAYAAVKQPIPAYVDYVIGSAFFMGIGFMIGDKGVPAQV